MAETWKPRAYQKKGRVEMLDAFRNGSGRMLLWDAGLGKTSTTLSVVSELINKGEIGEGPRGESMSVLVTAPLRVAQAVWAQEAEHWKQFSDLNVQLVWAPTVTEKQRRANTAADIYVINHESLEWLLDHWQGWVPDVVVVDEAAKFKNGQSKRFKALKRVLPHVKALYGLTATPAPNSLQDLWSQAYLVDRGKSLGPYITAMRKRFFTNIGYKYPDWQLRPGADEEIYEAIRPISLRLKIEGNIDLPSLNIIDVPVRLPDDAMKMYNEFERHLVAKLDDGSITAVHAASATTKLRQIANGSVYLSEDGEPSRSVQIVHKAKVRAAEDLLEEIEGPVMITYEFEHDVEGITEAVNNTRPDADIRRIGSKGATSAKAVQDIVGWWNDGANGNGVLILHPLSGGEGLNLQKGGRHVIWYGLPWRLDGYIQTIGRIWRSGQKKPVIVHRLVAQDTVDRDVTYALRRKDATQSDLLEALEARAR